MAGVRIPVSTRDLLLLFFSRLTIFSFCRFEALLVHQLMSEAGPLIKGGEEGAAKLVGS